MNTIKQQQKTTHKKNRNHYRDRNRNSLLNYCLMIMQFNAKPNKYVFNERVAALLRVPIQVAMLVDAFKYLLFMLGSRKIRS